MYIFAFTFTIVIRGELGELQIYFKKDTPASTKILVISVSISPWFPINLKKCPK